MSALGIFGSVLIVLGVITMLVGAIGVVRFPDFFTRLHAAGKGDTLGQGLVLLGLLCFTTSFQDGFKLVLIVVFILIVNPTATHALARAAWLQGLTPWVAPDKKPSGEASGSEEAI